MSQNVSTCPCFMDLSDVPSARSICLECHVNSGPVSVLLRTKVAINRNHTTVEYCTCGLGCTPPRFPHRGGGPARARVHPFTANVYNSTPKTFTMRKEGLARLGAGERSHRSRAVRCPH